MNTIEINGIGFKATMLTWELFTKKMECEFSDIPDKLKSDPVKCIMMLYVSGNEVYTKGSPQLKNMYDADEFYNELTKEDQQKLTSFFVDSMIASTKEMMEVVEESKKK